VIRVPSGVEGLKHIMAVDFHVILCDLVMPNLPGDMFYLAVERIKPQLCKRFIFMTGHGADPKWDAFIRKVRGLVLFKPFPLHDLLAAIHNVLQKQ
jgi:DNA-binding NarL/FixJ family response regulator